MDFPSGLTHRNAQMRTQGDTQCEDDQSELPKPDPRVFDLPDDPEVTREFLDREFLERELRAKREAASAARRVRFSVRTDSPPPSGSVSTHLSSGEHMQGMVHATPLGGDSATCARIQMLPRPKSPFPGPPIGAPPSWV